MKKIYFLLFLIITGSFSYGQELLLNGDFETWTSSTAPTSWTTAVNVTQETTIIHGGTSSAKQAPTATSAIVQKITGLTPGDAITSKYLVQIFWRWHRRKNMVKMGK
jgi:hypothetical protein